MQLQHRTTTIQVALSRYFARSVVGSVRRDVDPRKFAADGISAGGNIDNGVHADFQIRRKIHRDVTNTGLESGVAELAVHGHELGSNTACAGLGTDTMCHPKTMNASAAGLSLDRTTAAAGKPNAPAAGLYIHGPGYAADLDI